MQKDNIYALLLFIRILLLTLLEQFDQRTEGCQARRARVLVEVRHYGQEEAARRLRCFLQGYRHRQEGHQDYI